MRVWLLLPRSLPFRIRLRLLVGVVFGVVFQRPPLPMWCKMNGTTVPINPEDLITPIFID